VSKTFINGTQTNTVVNLIILNLLACAKQGMMCLPCVQLPPGGVVRTLLVVLSWLLL